MKKSKGFTLIELLMIIAIAAIVITLGLPSFLQTVRSSSLTSNTNELVTALNFARSEAVKRNEWVSVARAGTEWEEGWQVFTDPNGDGIIDAGESLLRTHSRLPNNYTLRATTGFSKKVTYKSTGMSSAGSFVLCENSDGNNIPEAYTSRVITINNVGRVRIGIDADNDGIPEKSGGEITSCTVSPFT